MPVTGSPAASYRLWGVAPTLLVLALILYEYTPYVEGNNSGAAKGVGPRGELWTPAHLVSLPRSHTATTTSAPLDVASGSGSGGDDDDGGTCDNVRNQPVNLRCAYVKDHIDICDPGGFINYIELYYCSFKPFPWYALFLLWLVILFYVLGDSAESFFCPTLETLTELLNISPNLAGVTFLAFGNGAPDVFSSIAAFAGGGSGSGLPLGAMLGAGVFVTTVVVGSVALNSKAKVNRRPFLRDVIAYIVAVLFLGAIFFDRKVHLAEALGFLCLYLSYVTIVLVSRYIHQKRKSSKKGLLISENPEDRDTLLDDGDDDDDDDDDDGDQTTATAASGASLEEGSGGVGARKRKPRMVRHETQAIFDFSNMGKYAIKRAKEPWQHQRHGHSGGRSADDLATLLERQRAREGQGVGQGGRARYHTTAMDVSAYDDDNPWGLPPHEVGTATATGTGGAGAGAAGDRHSDGPEIRTVDASGAITVHTKPAVGRAAGQRSARASGQGQSAGQGKNKNKYGGKRKESAESMATIGGSNSLTTGLLDEVYGDDIDQVVSDDLSDSDGGSDAPVMSFKERHLEAWREKGYIEKAMTILTFPFQIALLITIPQVGEDTWHRETCTLATLLAPFLSLRFAGIFLSGVGPVKFLYIAPVLAVALSVSCYVFSTRDKPPRRLRYALVLLGFVMSVVWIYRVANELVAVLTSFGVVMGISPTIIGLTILAWGNSIGDLVADTTIAKSGYPAMAIAGTYAGPMFNMLVGLGLALTIVTIRSYPEPKVITHQADIPLAFGFLLGSLVLSALSIPSTGFVIHRRWGMFLILYYLTFLLFSFLTAFNVILK